jgi:hypothetical protein
MCSTMSATTSETELQMKACIKCGDYTGVLGALASAERVNARMLNMSFTAKVEMGQSVEGATVEMLQSCQAHAIKPNVAMHNNVLATLSHRRASLSQYSLSCPSRS